MIKKIRSALVLSLALFSANVAMAGDAVVGALLGTGAGALIGNSVNGRDGALVGAAVGAITGAAIAGNQHRSRGGYGYSYGYAPAPVYVAPPAYYYPEQQVYYSPPVRVVQPYYYGAPVVYGRDDGRRYRNNGWDRRGHRGDRR